MDVTDRMVNAAREAYADPSDGWARENDMRAALSAALAAAWVPCAERMPEEGVDVLIVFGLDRVVTIARWNGERAWWSDEGRVQFPADEVTHWCPLLAPPKD